MRAKTAHNHPSAAHSVRVTNSSSQVVATQRSANSLLSVAFFEKRFTVFPVFQISLYLLCCGAGFRPDDKLALKKQWKQTEIEKRRLAASRGPFVYPLQVQCGH